jgi:excisionase family DNA binding protein
VLKPHDGTRTNLGGDKGTTSGGSPGGNTRGHRVRRTLPNDVRPVSWAAEQLGIGVSTAYRLAPAGRLPGAFRVGGQWRVSVPRFLAEVHGPRDEIVDATSASASSTVETGQDPGHAPGSNALASAAATSRSRCSSAWA